MDISTKYEIDQIVNFQGHPARIISIHIRLDSKAIRHYQTPPMTIRYGITTKKYEYSVFEEELSPWEGEPVEIKTGHELYG
jgi:hypothetical protein